jgi:uncharacterized protein (TIGR02284 family)
MATASLDKAVDQLNSLLRGEISAVETYKQAVKTVDDEHTSDALALRAIAQEHGEHAQALRDEVRRLGGEPDDSSGAWGAWAKTVEATAKLFGDASALKALKEGEEHGSKDYEEALSDVDGPARELIVTRLIPAQRQHIQILDGMMQKIERMGD